MILYKNCSKDICFHNVLSLVPVLMCIENILLKIEYTSCPSMCVWAISIKQMMYMKDLSHVSAFSIPLEGPIYIKDSSCRTVLISDFISLILWVVSNLAKVKTVATIQLQFSRKITSSSFSLISHFRNFCQLFLLFISEWLSKLQVFFQAFFYYR